MGRSHTSQGSKKGKCGELHLDSLDLSVYIITDNGKPFYNSLVTQLCEKFEFKQYKSSLYNVPANGFAEAFNKTLCNLLKKVVKCSKRDWHENIGKAL